MYDEIDDDLAKNYNQEEVAKKQRTPKFPNEVTGLTKANLKRVRKGESDMYGKFYEFRFSVLKAQDPLLVEDATYQLQFYIGASKVDNEGFWTRVTPLLMAVNGATVAAKFNAAAALGELCKICKDDESAELNLPFDIMSRQEPAKPKKGRTELEPNQKNPDGTPKKYRRDDFRIAG